MILNFFFTKITFNMKYLKKIIFLDLLLEYVLLKRKIIKLKMKVEL